MYRAWILTVAAALALAWPARAAEPDNAVETGSLPDAQKPTRPAARLHLEDRSLTLVLAGDTGFSGTMEPVRPDAGLRHGTPHPWAQITGGIAAEINGDLNFANLETVVTDRNDLAPLEKAFNFRAHPAGVRHLVEMGFNLISTANNHSADYGERGIRETVRHLDALEPAGLKAHVGLGMDREAAVRPRLVQARGTTVLLAAVGIGSGSHRAGEGRPGQALYSVTEDFNAALTRLAAADGGYRILSVHYGEELQVAPSANDVRKLRDEAVRRSGIDLVVGHHAHVAAGVQEVEGKLIFYGLGNFLHLGMQDMSRFGLCRDYGLLARLYLAPGPDGRLRARAVEAVPLTGMHVRATRMQPSQAAARIHVLNHLASRLDDAASKARGVRFAPQPDGTGLYCAPDAGEEAGRIGAMCRDWREPPAAPDALARQIAGSCGTSYVSEARRGRSPAEAAKSKSGNPFAALFGF